MILPDMKKQMLQFKKGFTLIEILLVVAILSVLLVVVFASLNPAARLEDARNARRWNDVNQVLTALHECIVDNDGSLTTCGLLTDPLLLSQIGSCGTGGATPCTGAETACLNLDGVAVLDDYIAGFPVDPTDPGVGKTAYAVQVTNGIITVSACQDEGGEVIQVAR